MAVYCSNCGAASNGGSFCASCGASNSSASAPSQPTYTNTNHSTSPSNSNNVAMWAHLGGLLAGFLVPLIIRSTETARRDRYVLDQATEALNFHLHWMLVSIGLFIGISIITVVTFGLGAVLYFVCFIPSILILVFGIMASVAASRGENYRYPMMMFRLVK